MKWPTRLATLLITLSMALAIVALVRGSSSDTITIPVIDVAAVKTSIVSEFLSPRNLRLRIASSQNVSLMLKDSVNDTVATDENSGARSLNIQIGRRGIYTILIFNPQNTTQGVRLDLTVYGFEADLIQASIILAAAGVTLIVANQILQTVGKRRLHAQPI